MIETIALIPAHKKGMQKVCFERESKFIDNLVTKMSTFGRQ